MRISSPRCATPLPRVQGRGERKATDSGPAVAYNTPWTPRPSTRLGSFHGVTPVTRLLSLTRYALLTLLLLGAASPQHAADTKIYTEQPTIASSQGRVAV